MMLRQGDVFLEPIDESHVPENLKPVSRDNGRVVLAYGEATGHAHSIYEKRVKLLSEDAGRDVCYLKVDCEEALLQHEEHASAVVLKGWYRVRRQIEEDDEEAWLVAD